MMTIRQRIVHVVKLCQPPGTSRSVVLASPCTPRNQIRHLSQSTSKVPFYGEARAPSSSTRLGTGTTSCPVGNRIFLAAHNAATALRDPTRADAVAALGEITGRVALEDMLRRMKADPVGREILQDRPVVTKASIPYQKYMDLSKEKTETFGEAYGAFLLGHGFDPDDRDPVKYISDPDLAYVMLRYRQCHDYWHAITGLPPTVLGEIGLKWLELFQTGLPIAALSSTVGSLALTLREHQILWNLYLPWAIRMHKNSREQQHLNGSPPFLMNVYYEKEFDTPLEELRARLCIEPAPQIGLNY